MWCCMLAADHETALHTVVLRSQGSLSHWLHVTISGEWYTLSACNQSHCQCFIVILADVAWYCAVTAFPSLMTVVWNILPCLDRDIKQRKSWNPLLCIYFCFANTCCITIVESVPLFSKYFSLLHIMQILSSSGEYDIWTSQLLYKGVGTFTFGQAQ